MKIYVKTLRGSNFAIEVKSEDTVADVKKNIESVEGQEIYPAAQQMIFRDGQILSDRSTMEQSGITENCFLIVMPNKATRLSGEGVLTPAASTAKGSQTSTSDARAASVESAQASAEEATSASRGPASGERGFSEAS